VDISFKSTKLQKQFNEGRQLEKKQGSRRAKLIRLRMAELRAALSLADFLPPKSGPCRCHELTQGKRVGQLSVDLDHPYRLIFVPNYETVPVKPDGGLHWEQVTVIVIIEIEDTHE
jgi:proteic killer suppression protein